jgi:RNA polymerase primary sigma factor
MVHINEHTKPIRLPLNKVSIVNKIKRAANHLEQSLQRTASSYEISEYMNEQAIENPKAQDIVMTPQYVEEIMAIGGSFSSLDVPIGQEGDSTTLHDIIPGESSYDVNNLMKQRDLQYTIMKVINSKLSTREKEVICYFFGIDNKQQKTLDEIGGIMDLTRERVRQIKEKALRKMKLNSAKEELMSYL